MVFNKSLRLLTGALGVFVIGCNAQEDVTPEPEEINPYFAVKISDFVGTRAIPVYADDVGAEWVEVELPTDLLANAP